MTCIWFLQHCLNLVAQLYCISSNFCNKLINTACNNSGFCLTWLIFSALPLYWISFIQFIFNAQLSFSHVLQGSKATYLLKQANLYCLAHENSSLGLTSSTTMITNFHSGLSSLLLQSCSRLLSKMQLFVSTRSHTIT